MLRARLLRGFRMLRRFRYAVLVFLYNIFLADDVSAVTWYCKDPACRSPVAEGTAGYDYNPSKLVVNHGYIPVNVGDNILAFKQSNRPSILEVEVKGQRGYIPRTLFDASKSYMGEGENFVTMEGPIVLPEDEIVAMESVPSQNAEPHASNPETLTAPPAQDDKITSTPGIPLGGESGPPKTAVPPVDTLVIPVQEAVTAPSRSDSLPTTIMPGGIVDKKVDNVVADSSKTQGTTVGDSGQNAVTDTTGVTETAAGVPSKDPPGSPASVPSVPASPETVPSTSTTGSGVVNDDALAKSLTTDSAVAKLSEPPAAPPPASSLREAETGPVDENVVDVGDTKSTESPVPPKSIEGEPSQLSEARDTSLENKKDHSPAQGDTLPFAVPSHPDLGQLAGELTGSKVSAPPTPEKTEATPQLNSLPVTKITTLSSQAVNNPSTEIKPTASSGQESTTLSPVGKEVPLPIPEPIVTHQDPTGEKLGLSGLQKINPLPVINTTGFVRHRHHNHNPGHGHSHHDHSHGGHSHRHSHDDHRHDHSGHDHSQDGSGTSPPSLVQAAKEPRVAPTSTPFPETDTKVEAENPATKEPEMELTMHLSSKGSKTDEVAVLNSTGTGQLDPSTATQAPKIPMVENFDSSRISTNSEEQKAIDESERYNRPRPDQMNSRDQRRINAGEVHDHHDDHGHDHSHHDHDHSHDEGLEGSCSAKGGESCEQLTHVTDHVPSPELLAHNASASSGFAHVVMDTLLHGWLYAVTEFETLSGGLRLGGMLVFAALALISMMSAAADRGVRKTMEKGFEEYDYKKETEMLALREQVKVLLKENEEHTKAGGKNSPVAPPPYMPPTVPLPMFGGPTHGNQIVGLPPTTVSPPVGPCTKCAELQHMLQTMRGQLDSNEKVLRDQRETYASILTKNNEVTTELTLVANDRDVTKRSLEDTAQRLVDAERKLNQKAAEAVRNMNGGHAHVDSEAVQEVVRLKQRISQLENECEVLRRNNSQSNGLSREDKTRMERLQREVNEAAAKVGQLQAERDEASSNVRLLRQLLTEKEEEIRKMRATEAAGGVSASRELQEKTDELRNARKQVSRLQDELESVKRDRETQIQIRCQTFRAAADKSQRDALMARQEAWAVKQQLEEVCKRHGENVPPITNGITPPGMMATSPMMFSGVGFPPGPPPPSLEAFKQQVLAQQQPRSSGHSSPRSPDLEHDRARDRRKERKTVKKSRTLDFPPNGKDGEDHDDSEGKRDRTYR
ncbi:hypothetical protein RvY_10060 [Ramazzottius varieornatus]|uniref:SH3 domain-containing protein n=1 Tax=Ramazzottius varieornatus TaxID=947166 RepID=A0A1D1VKI3_RAMVA|nr:hypothetical protein RvY_10060 [Ramazzottius varieornatus]